MVIGHSRSQRQEMACLAFIKSAFTAGQLDVRHPEIFRTFLWMNDLIRAVEAAIRAPPSPHFRIYHLGSFATTIGQIALGVSSMTGAFVRQHPHLGEDVTGLSLSSDAFKSDLTSNLKGTQRFWSKNLFRTPDIVGREKSDTPRDSKILNSDACGVCGPGTDDNVMRVLDLGEQPFANDFKTDIVESTSTKRFTLRLILCRVCHHVQSSCIVDRSELFLNYL